MVIDAHTHIVRRLHGRVGVGRSRSLTYGRAQIGASQPFQHVPPFRRETTFPPDVLIAQMDWAGVDRAVLLQGSFHGEANDYVAAAVARYPGRFIGAAFVDPRAPDAEASFARLTGEQRFGVLKLELSVATGFLGLYPDLRLDEPGLAWLWPAAERQGVIVVLDLGAVGAAAYQTEAVEKIVAAHPALRVVIAHLGQPPLTAPDDVKLNTLWEAQIALGRHANVWFDLAALPAYAPEDYPFPTALRYIARAVERIGATRLMWGSDVPGLLGQATYPQLLSYLTRHSQFLTDEARAAVLGGNAERLFDR